LGCLTGEWIVARIIYPCEVAFPGPWLLDSSALTELDSLIAEQWKRLSAYKKKEIEKTFDREKYQLQTLDSYNQLDENARKEEDKKLRQKIENDPLYSDDGYTVTLTLVSNVKVVESSFTAADSAPECQGQLVKKAEVRIVCGGIKVEMIVPAPDKLRSLSLLTLPEGSEPAVEAFIKFRKWADERRPDWLLCYRVRPLWVLGFLLFCWRLLSA